MVSFSDLKFYRDTSLGATGGPIDTTREIPSATPLNLYDGFTRDNLITGVSKHRCFYIKNTSTEDMENFKIGISSGTPSPDTYINWGFDSTTNPFDGAVGFDGVNDYIDCTNDTDLWSKSLSRFAFSVFVYPNSTGVGSERYIVSHGDTSPSGFTLAIDSADVHKINFTIKDSGGGFHTASATNLDINDWNHVICSYESGLGSDNIKIYINGELEGTANFTSAINLSSTLTLAGPTNDFKGYMRDFKFWDDDGIDTDEAIELYETDRILTQTESYHLNFSERTGTTSKDRASGTKVGTFINETFWKKNSQTIASEYVEPDIYNGVWYDKDDDLISIGTLKTGEYFPIWCKIVGSDPEAKSYIDDSCIFSVQFDVSTATGGTGTPGGTTTAFKTFNGTSEKIDVADAAALDLNQFSIAARFRTTKNYRTPTATDAAGEEGVIVMKGKWVGPPPQINYGMWVTDTNGLRGGFEEADGTDHLAKIFRANPDEASPGDVVTNDGQWHIGVITHDGIDVKCYLDGNEMDSRPTGGATPTTTSTPLRIGANNFEGFEDLDGIRMYFKGDLDFVYIWNNDLTPTEITDLKDNIIPQESNIVYSNDFNTSSGGTSGGGGTPQTNADYKICFIGDEGCEPETDDCISLIKSQNYNLVISVGDHAYESASCWTGKFSTIKDKMESAFGNHEYSEGGISPYKSFFGYSLTYNSFRFQNMLILIIDTNDDESSAPSLDSQKIWAQAELEKYKNDSSVTWRIAVMHHPWFGSGADHAGNEFSQVQKFHKLFTDYQVSFVYTGHNHNWQRSHKVAYNASNPRDGPIIVSSSSPYSRTSGGLIAIVSGTGGHDSGGSLYTLPADAAFWAYRNRSHNGVHELVASNNGNTLTGKFRDRDGSTTDTFVINA